MFTNSYVETIEENKKKKSVIYKRVLGKFGFDLENPGYPLFVDLIDDLKDVFSEEVNIEDVKLRLPNYYTEHHHFVQHMGRFEYLRQIQEFCDSRNKEEKTVDTALLDDTSMDNTMLDDTSMDNTIIYFAQYLYPIVKDCIGDEKSIKAVPIYKM